MSSPFLADSDLAYSVYGFFQNGGSRCYVKRVAHWDSVGGKFTSVPATVTIGVELTSGIEAKDAGEWGNKLKLSAISANVDDNTKFDFSVLYDGETVEKYSALSNTVDTEDYWIDVINGNSNYISAVSGSLEVADESTLAGGEDYVGVSSDIVDADYELALASFDAIDDVNLLCIPGQTSVGVNTALMTYCENRGDIFAILDAPKASTVESVKALRKTMSCKVASLNFPWIRVTDPLSKTGKLRDCPVSGHIMGVYARTIKERGEWKAPAGVEATLRGAIEVMTVLNDQDLAVLNPLGIVSIIPKTNYGIVIWGARSISPDSSMKYISDILLDINLKKSIKQGTQWVVFEPHDSKLWTRVTTTIQDFMYGKWQDGALFGDTPEQAYFVKCDEDLNPQAIRDAGKIICEVGYARKRPAEFVIFRVSHELASN